MTNKTLTKRSLHLMREVRDGRDRIFYLNDRPSGFVQAERAGYLKRVLNTDRAELTDEGRDFLRVSVTGF